MPETLRGVDADRLERSCNGRRDSIRFGAGASGLERAEVYLSTCAYEPHRHDTYAIGITIAGVQTFRYRGLGRVCLPGQLHVLHPDECMTGPRAPRRLRLPDPLHRAGARPHALDGSALPFVADPSRSRRRRPAPRLPTCRHRRPVRRPRPSFDRSNARRRPAVTRRDAPARRERSTSGQSSSPRDYLAAHAGEQTPASTLERISGTDRFTLARHFRRAYGTSPDRYRTLRRLALARTAIEAGRPLAQAAAEAGFADQSHMTRQFKRSYGLTPARWTALVGADDRGIRRGERRPRASQRAGQGGR